jgi:putative cell wall-binding protein
VSVPSSVAGKRDLGLAQVGPDDFPVFPRIAEKNVQPPLGSPQPLGYGDLDPHSPAVGADGTLAFVGSGGNGPSLFVDEGSGPVAVASLGADCPGQRPSFAPSATAIAFVVSAADCASSQLRVLPKTQGTYAGAGSQLVAASTPGRYFETASWRPVTPAAAAFRLSGKDRIATGIAVSEWNYSDGAQGAVIASATNFPDAVVGGPLAAQLDMPLLLTNPTSLDSRVAAHLKKLTEAVTTPKPLVYIIGSTGAVSATVERSLARLGYDVVRIAGPDRYATSVEVARTLDAGYAAAGYTGPRSAAFLADGRNFPDALSAGPAAAQLLGSVLLTNGTSVPAVVRSYLNSRRDISTIHSVGRSAAQASGVFGTRALGNSVVGSDRYQTSALTARTFFAAGAYIGYASGENFPDALTGGAMMGSIWEPLVLVRPTIVPTSVRNQARAYRAGTDAVVVFGSAAVVSAGVQTQLVAAAGRQTAFYGPSVEVVANPDLPAAPAGAQLSAQGRDHTPVPAPALPPLGRRGGDAVPAPRHR